MTDLDDLIASIPIEQIAGQLGVDAQTARDAVATTLPAILGGLQANAKDPAGAASLEHAVQSKDGSLLDGGVDLSQIDTTDGEKIVKNVFGDNTDQVAAALGGAPGSQNTSLVSKLLPMLAPIVMAYLAKTALGGGKGTTGASSSGGGIGDVLGGLLGGKSGSAGGLEDVLGQLTGGSGAGGGLADVLGGLLGGGKH